MNFPLSKSSLGGKLGYELNRLAEAINSLRPVSAPGVFTSRTTGGTVLRPDSPRGTGGTGAVEFQWLTTVREGLDAVECVDANDATVYVLKPAGFRAQGFIFDSGDIFNATVLTTYNAATTGNNPGQALAEYKQAFEVPSVTYPFVIRHVKGITADDGASNTWADDSTALGGAVFRIGPHYTEYQDSGGGLNIFGTELLAASHAPVLIDAADLRIGGAEDASAALVDLSPRYWEPLNVFLNVTLLRQRSDGLAQSEHGIAGGRFPFP